MDWAPESSWTGAHIAPLVHEHSTHQKLLAISLDAPPVGAKSLNAFEQVITFADGSVVASLGEVERIETSGKHRFLEVKQKAEELFKRISLQENLAVCKSRLRLLGGFSFTDKPHDGKWSAFPNTLFWLPRFTYTQKADTASITCITTFKNKDQDFQFLKTLAASLGQSGSSPSAETHCIKKTPTPTLRSSDEFSSWSNMIKQVVELIDKNEFSKVVLSRQHEIDLAEHFSPKVAFQRLVTKNENGSHFRFKHGDSCFLGSSPEKLISKVGHHVETEAIAGTIANDVEQFESKLESSAKDIVEHQFVVDLIQGILADTCESLSVEGPTIKNLRHVAHLKSAFKGVLKTDTHILDLVEKLHPTPAMAGVPTKKALETIEELEPHSRGWYASPVGWFDANGDGEFSVAIRSALIADSKATLFAGGGIVKKSLPEKEFHETELKFSTIKEVLGIDF